MKSKILLQAIGVSFLCAAALPSVAQTGRGASAGTGTGAGASATPGNASAHGGAQQQIQAGQPLVGGASADVNAPATTTTADNSQQQSNPQLAATNAAAGIPTPPNTNVDSFPSGQPLSPTSQIGATNAVYPTNSAATNTTPEWLQRDQAITEQDRAMLMQMRQAVFQGQSLSGWMHTIHFILKEGSVRLVGTVPSLAERQRIETIVTQIPGVVKVYDALAVNPLAAEANASPANAPVNANPAALPPTSFAPTNTQAAPQTGQPKQP
jgi:hypothetical protein